MKYLTIMDNKEDYSESVKYVEEDSICWYQAKFESRRQAETIRSSSDVKLHPSDDKREKTVRLDTATRENVLEHISKNAKDQSSTPDNI